MISVILIIGLMMGMSIFLFMNVVAPNTLTITSGSIGSTLERNAEKYKEILAKNGITLKIPSSEGSMDSFNKLHNPKVAVDISFVLGGQTNGANIDNLVSKIYFLRAFIEVLNSSFRECRMAALCWSLSFARLRYPHLK